MDVNLRDLIADEILLESTPGGLLQDLRTIYTH